MRIRWVIIYVDNHGQRQNAWQEWGETKSEAIREAEQHHRNDLQRGYRIIDAIPA